jgi:hypothetical protein
MKFVVSKGTVSLSDIKKPCEEAKLEELSQLDYRDVKTLEEAKSRIWYNDWIKRGENHREENGVVVCDLKDKVRQWVIDINSLEELVSFQSKYGDILISNSTPYRETNKEVTIQSTL